jgi:hypothetical protein
MPSSTQIGHAANPYTNDVAEVINALRQRRGNFSAHVHARISASDPFFKYISREKMPFPSQRGDVYEREVFHITTPTEKDLGTWTPIQKASAGYNPSADTYEAMLNYGSTVQTCRLYRKGWRTPHFNKISLAMTHDADAQIANVKAALTAHTMAIWPAWCRQNFRRSVACRTLNTTYGHAAEQIGGYKAGITPSSLLTHEWLESMLPGILATPIIADTPAMKEAAEIPEQVVFMGYQEFTQLEKQYREATVNYGFNAPDVTLPELGLSGKKIGKYLFVLEKFPTRFRDVEEGETWEDAIIPHTVRVAAQGGAAAGYQDKENPDYNNPAIAKYSEAKVYNIGSVIWFTPPTEVLQGMKKGEVFQFPASTYTGEFIPVNMPTQEDPEAENIFFIAKYISGMMGANPLRSKCVLALAAHTTATNYTLSGALPAGEGPFYVRAVQVSSLHPNGDLLVFVAGTLPATPPAHSLYLVRPDGTRFLIDTVVGNSATAGNGETVAGRTLQLQLDDTDEQAADASLWAELVCLAD